MENKQRLINGKAMLQRVDAEAADHGCIGINSDFCVTLFCDFICLIDFFWFNHVKNAPLFKIIYCDWLPHLNFDSIQVEHFMEIIGDRTVIRVGLHKRLHIRPPLLANVSVGNFVVLSNVWHFQIGKQFAIGLVER